MLARLKTVGKCLLKMLRSFSSVFHPHSLPRSNFSQFQERLDVPVITLILYEAMCSCFDDF